MVPTAAPKTDRLEVDLSLYLSPLESGSVFPPAAFWPASCLFVIDFRFLFLSFASIKGDGAGRDTEKRFAEDYSNYNGLNRLHKALARW